MLPAEAQSDLEILGLLGKLAVLWCLFYTTVLTHNEKDNKHPAVRVTLGCENTSPLLTLLPVYMMIFDNVCTLILVETLQFQSFRNRKGLIWSAQLFRILTDVFFGDNKSLSVFRT